MKKKWRNFFRVLMIAPAPALFPTEQDKYEAYEQSLERQPDGMPAPLQPGSDSLLEYPYGQTSDETEGCEGDPSVK